MPYQKAKLKLYLMVCVHEWIFHWGLRIYPIYFSCGSTHCPYDLGRPAIPDICDEPALYWVLIEDNRCTLGTGTEYTVDSTVHERREFATAATKFEKFDVTVSMMYTESAGTVVEMLIYIPGSYKLTIFLFQLRLCVIHWLVYSFARIMHKLLIDWAFCAP